MAAVTKNRCRGDQTNFNARLHKCQWSNGTPLEYTISKKQISSVSILLQSNHFFIKIIRYFISFFLKKSFATPCIKLLSLS